MYVDRYTAKQARNTAIGQVDCTEGGQLDGTNRQVDSKMQTERHQGRQEGGQVDSKANRQTDSNVGVPDTASYIRG